MEKILFFVELKDGRPRKASLELLSEGRKLADTGRFSVEAVTLGDTPDEARSAILPYVEKVVNITDPVLNSYTAEGHSAALAAYAKEWSPKIILAGATRMGRDFMPRVAILLQSGIASDVTGIDWEGEPVTCLRPVFGGKVTTKVSFTAFPAIVTTRPNTFSVIDPGNKPGEFVTREIGLSADQIKTKVLRIEKEAREKVDLGEADTIVSGGQGLKSAENFTLLEELADVIGGAVGATRSAVDAKWRGYEDQVGKSGKTVAPKLYIAAGISGAIHHIMGMGTSKVVVAINKDQNAPIFKYSNYGIVGDLFEVIPALTEALKRRLGK